MITSGAPADEKGEAMSLLRAVTAGGLAGLAGSAVMLPIFTGAKRTGVAHVVPPEQVVEGAAAAAAVATEGGGPIEPADRAATAAGSHLLYGAAAGVLYGLIQDELRLPAIPAGVGFGIAVWGFGYLGWLPATHLLPPPWRQQPGDALTPVAAHLAYGVVLGAIERAVRE